MVTGAALDGYLSTALFASSVQLFVQDPGDDALSNNSRPLLHRELETRTQTAAIAFGCEEPDQCMASAAKGDLIAIWVFVHPVIQFVVTLKIVVWSIASDEGALSASLLCR